MAISTEGNCYDPCTYYLYYGFGRMEKNGMIRRRKASIIRNLGLFFQEERYGSKIKQIFAEDLQQLFVVCLVFLRLSRFLRLFYFFHQNAMTVALQFGFITVDAQYLCDIILIQFEINVDNWYHQCLQQHDQNKNPKANLYQ